MRKNKLFHSTLGVISAGIILFSNTIPVLAEPVKEQTINNLEKDASKQPQTVETAQSEPEDKLSDAEGEEKGGENNPDGQMDDSEAATASSEEQDNQSESESSHPANPAEDQSVEQVEAPENKSNEPEPTVKKQPEVKPEKPAVPSASVQPPANESSQTATISETPTEEDLTPAYPPRSLDTTEFILLIGEQARMIAQKQDLYASVMIAQAILESGSGSSMLAAAPNFNLFGIKGSCLGRSVSLNTQEDDGTGNLYTVQAAFKKYDSYQESLEDYARLMRSGLVSDRDFYAGVRKSKAMCYEEAAAYLQGRYATDIHYAQKLDRLIQTYDLTQYDRSLKLSRFETKKTQAVRTEALKYLGIPYVWGGTTPAGFDCSGLVQYVFKKALDIDTERVTTQQERSGVEVPLNALRTGDLLFWGNRGASHHVAIYIGNGEFIQAPETGDVVKITKLKDFMPDFAKRII